MNENTVKENKFILWDLIKKVLILLFSKSISFFSHLTNFKFKSKSLLFCISKLYADFLRVLLLKTNIILLFYLSNVNFIHKCNKIDNLRFLNGKNNVYVWVLFHNMWFYDKYYQIHLRRNWKLFIIEFLKKIWNFAKMTNFHF